MGTGGTGAAGPSAPAGAAVPSSDQLSPATGAEGLAVAVPEVEIGRIEPNPRQPRRHIDPAELDELVASVREHGVLQPLVVTPMGDGEGAAGRYHLVAGERRWRAAKLAGLTRVPVVVRGTTPRELLELALVENLQRADLNPIEEANAFQQLAEELGLTQEEIGRRIGRSRIAVANTIRLLQLPASVQQAVIDGVLSEGHARAILGLPDREAQRRMAGLAAERGLSVRQTEELVRRAQAAERPRDGHALPRRRDADVAEVEARFQEALGTKVTLNRSRRGGRLVIHYYDDEQLQELYDRLSASEG
jgi:ParB family chromosome partitioning protein